MKIKENFEMVRVVDDYVIVPVGDQMETFNGTVVLNEVSAFMIEKLKSDITKDDLVRCITTEYEIDLATAQRDVNIALEKMKKIGIIDD